MGSVSTTFVGETPLGGVGGCPFHIMTVLGLSTTRKTMLKISARSDNGKCFKLSAVPKPGWDRCGVVLDNSLAKFPKVTDTVNLPCLVPKTFFSDSKGFKLSMSRDRAGAGSASFMVKYFFRVPKNFLLGGNTGKSPAHEK